MNGPQLSETSYGRRLWNSIVKELVVEVPDDIAYCEFNCRELNCEQGKWETCENRLRFMASVEEHRTKAAKRGKTEGRK